MSRKQRVQPLHLTVSIGVQFNIGVQLIRRDRSAADGVLRGRPAAGPAGLTELARVVLLRLVLVVGADLGEDVHPLLLFHAVVGLARTQGAAGCVVRLVWYAKQAWGK